MANKVSLGDWQNAVALVTAYEADVTNELWKQIYSGVEKTDHQYMVFALTALCANICNNLSQRIDIPMEEILSGISLTLEEKFNSDS
jgi:hypothetical protein